VLYLVASHITHPVLYGRMICRFFYCRLPCRLAFVMVFFSIVGILMMRVARFMGVRAADPSPG